MGLVFAGCQSDGYDYDDYDEYLAQFGCNPGDGVACRDNASVWAAGAAMSGGQMSAPVRLGAGVVPQTASGAMTREIRFSTPRGNDLVLETPGYVLQVEGTPNRRYDYYVWTGEKKYSDDPDLIIQDGVAAVLKQ